jgi:adenylate cyclase
MGVEIERKFLVRDDSWRKEADAGEAMRQGYLCSDAVRTVRVRVGDAGTFLTIKGKGSGLSRAEFEYAIPEAEGVQLLALCDQLVEKVRYRVPHAGLVWEVDVFAGANQGLVLAELELESEDQPFSAPAWVGGEVSGDRRYFNAYLSRHPFSGWPAL